VVAEMTGYPPELLDLDLDLEADLGVDTVKQAEVFAAVRARFGVERDETLKLRDFPTLTHVIGWIRDKTTTTPTGPATAPATVTRTVAPAMAGDLAATDRYPRRIPVPVLRPALQQCLPTGVILGGARVLVVPDGGGVAAAIVQRLGSEGATPLMASTSDPDALLAQVEAWRAEGRIDGVYWLRALDDEGPVEAMDLDAWRTALRLRVKDLYAVMRRLVDDAPFLVSGTCLGGFHGYDDVGATAPLGGAVTGFTKAYHREQPDTVAKAVDVPLGGAAGAVAEALLGETLRDPGCVEVGHADGRRWSIGLAEAPFTALGAGLPLTEDTVFVVTGAAGSIVSAITANLAQASRGTFHLLDLTPTPDPADRDLARLVDDRDGLKKDIAARLRERGDRPTPVRIEKELARCERLSAALAAIEAVQAAGGTAHYYPVDLTDGAAVAAVIDQVRSTSGRIDVLLHAAGLEVSRGLSDKEPGEYDLVFDVKADGWFNLLHAAGDLPVGATVCFSSVAGRFGNAGQTDYSAANDLLCKVTSSFRRTRPDTRGLVLDWTAWAGIGMASRGSIPAIMEAAGIEMLRPEAGIAWVRRELTSNTRDAEVVVAGRLGVMTAEANATGGLDPSSIDTSHAGPMVDAVAAAGVHSGLVVRTTLDPARQPFLDHHRIDGTALLPGVMAVEAFAEVAGLLAPDLAVLAVEDVDFIAPLKFYKDLPRTMTIRATVRRDGSGLVADCRLEAERTLPGSETPQVTTHQRARVRLGLRQSGTEREAVPADDVTPALTPAQVYAAYFHGPAYQVVGSAWRHDGGDAARLASSLPADHDPADGDTVLDPRLVELCFQTAGLWEIGHDDRFALPQHVDSIRPGKPRSESSGPLYAVARPSSGGFDCAVVDGTGDVVVRVDGYRTVELPGGITDEARAPLAAAMHDSP
jgi:NAD(P)-dependent dehydrogenase (short-subunit alcohol dehydrogenase family)